MTLKENIVDIIRRHCEVPISAELVSREQAADAILAALRAHMTSPKAVERACETFWIDGRTEYLGDSLSRAIHAALGEE